MTAVALSRALSLPGRPGRALRLGAWVGSREGRRRTGDLLATTARPAWSRQASALAGTLFWLLLAFLAGVAVLYIRTAQQATWGGPPLWPVAVGAVGVITCTAIGFALGAVFPGRFTAPLATAGVFVLGIAGLHAALNVSVASGTRGLLSPDAGPPAVDAGVYYHVPAGVSIAQVMFMGGITLAMLGLAALAPALRGFSSYRNAGLSVSRAGRWPCAVAAALVAAGAAASVTAYSLAGTAVPGPGGWAPGAGRSRHLTTRRVPGRSPTRRTARGPRSRCAFTRHSAPT